MSHYESLIDTKRNGGLACLCFRNQKKLSMEEIREIFSKYGAIGSINCAGDESGYRFVRYYLKSDALKCVMALENDPRIKFQTPKAKLKDPNDDEAQNQVDKKKPANGNGQRDKHVPRNSEQVDKRHSEKSSQSSIKSTTNDNRRQTRCSGTQNRLNGFNNTNNTNGEASNGNICSQKFPRNDENQTMKTSDLNLVRKPERRFPNHSINAAKLAQLHTLRGTIANTFKPHDNTDVFQVPAIPAAAIPMPIISSSSSSRNSNREQSVMTDMPPPLIAGVCSPQSSNVSVEEEKTDIILACDVIVANIHSNIGVSNIYHMLRKFSPIYVSDIETVPDINVRFCYVYLKTPNDALAVEDTFDGVSVLGQNLITLRSQRLEAEAGIF